MVAVLPYDTTDSLMLPSLPGPDSRREYTAAQRHDNDHVGTSYRLWVNDERTVLVRVWDSGNCEVATREYPSHTWGPPVYLEEERV